ncbi:DNA-directed RNA polymerase subunit beta [Cellulosilyticum lentocellum]|uniref:DNA-directed RNA polymerase subunit beta n=1 Tax=Cellulosilyticum lentocellum (strain ATCC 49066 / DSM 5427 / NCIMB 11756 / RHM5) TaxID=642492 RepID=F2JT21_CELLD|nr:DNA-directed RNA polymerase subunit beta [Cellulosilyticum lentocellum]ADZ85240.1 DNA-directed RNA polymerase, beta subunit [Cellulosilyticum lentocellum DSM 5427]
MQKSKMRPVNMGKQIRMSYARTEDGVLEIPNLVELQRSSYEWFLNEGLKEVFEDISPITDFNGNLILEFVDFYLDSKPKYTIEECRERDATYCAPLKVKARLHNKETGTSVDSEVFMGDFPLMTENATFIINGAERVIVSQLVRSPGIYYDIAFDKTGKKLFSASVIPNRGAWLEYETDSNDIFYVRVDRTRKVPITVLLRSLGLGSDAEIIEKFGEEPKILETIQKDTSKTYEEGLLEMYKRIRPGEPPTVDSAETLLRNMFFDPKRYDLAKVGRYKFNKKLALRNRVMGLTLADNVIDPFTGEIVASEGDKITVALANAIQNTGIEAIHVNVANSDKPIKIITNRTVELNHFVDVNPEELGIKDTVYYPVLEEILEQYHDIEEIKAEIKARKADLIPKCITLDDIFASINYNMHLEYEIGNTDDIDHLGNRRIRGVGELFQNQFRIGLSRMERVVRERMTIQDQEAVSPQAFINIRPVSSAIKEFFGSSQLSQFMDHNNPLAELTHKRRLSALGLGGLSRERAGFEVRDVHYSHYGRMCPIETPEGPNIGLINSLATFARINEYGFIEAPYRVIDKSGPEPRLTDEVIYITADEEEKYTVCQATEQFDEEGYFINKRVTARHAEDILDYDYKKIDLMDVSTKQIVSVATALIPFLENDDANRALMGANMQRQAVPLIATNSPIVATGMEYKIGIDSGALAVAREDGIVDKCTAKEIVVKDNEGKKHSYKLEKFERSNAGTCINQRPVVNKGDIVKKGDVLADGPSTQNGELALGQNPLIGFMTWEGYNYEDAILLSERLVQDDIYTSIHIEEYEVEARDTKVGPEEITRDIPNVGEDTLKDLDERGIIRIGAEVRSGDILVGRVTPKGETELTAEERLLRAIFGEKVREVRDTSLRVPHGEAGIIVDVKIFTRENGDELDPGVNKMVRCYIAQKRKISVGDKMAGRHGNKGVISRVLPVEDMPFLPNGRPLDIVLNPLGVPSRMNIGQVLEVHLGLAAKALGFKIETPVFNGATEQDIMSTLEMANDYVNWSWEEFEAKWSQRVDESVIKYLSDNRDHRAEWKGVPLDRTGKIRLRDGRTGEEFDNPVTVGYMHYLKLHHLVDDKMHARSTGPYATITQQPLGGKAQFGGQRFGEMEVWALEAYGAAYTLQEILTIKSDDVVGRVKTYESIVKGENIPEPGIPESFKVLLKELQSLSLDIRVLTSNMTEIDIKESVDEGEGIAPNVEVLEEIPEDGYIEENIDADGELDVEPDLFDDNIELDFEPEDDIIFEEDGLGDLDL